MDGWKAKWKEGGGCRHKSIICPRKELRFVEWPSQWQPNLLPVVSVHLTSVRVGIQRDSSVTASFLISVFNRNVSKVAATLPMTK